MLTINLLENKKVKKVKLNDLSSVNNKPMWIDCSDITKQETEELKNQFNIHPLSIEDFLNARTRVKVEEFPNYLFCVYYVINEKGKNYQLQELDIILGKNFVISNSKIKLDSIKRLQENPDKLTELLRKGPDFVFHHIIDNEIDKFFDVLGGIDNKIEDIEDSLAKKINKKAMTEILRLKKEIINIKRITLPQREKLSMLTKSGNQFISKEAIPYFRDVYDHAIRVSDTIENYREAIANTFDVYMSMVSNNMNEVMKVLSIIATIALPLTVISGIYGTNFQILPGSTNNYGFWAMIILMVAMVLAMIYFFNKRKWI